MYPDLLELHCGAFWRDLFFHSLAKSARVGVLQRNRFLRADPSPSPPELVEKVRAAIREEEAGQAAAV
jgi:hypothetical protein